MNTEMQLYQKLNAPDPIDIQNTKYTVRWWVNKMGYEPNIPNMAKFTMRLKKLEEQNIVKKVNCSWHPLVKCYKPTKRKNKQIVIDFFQKIIF